MRILMLGWEYPPHISGGLGTACEGLTTALAQRGIELLDRFCDRSEARIGKLENF